jgi:aryl-alcohol dehydrogenase-like predicted oxidoreductase
MKYRTLGKTNIKVSEIGLGTWQVGGKWGSTFDIHLAEKTLNTAADSGVNFIDTADVYSDGESEKAIGRFLKTRTERIFVATKCGRQLQPHASEAYQPKALRKFIENSLINLQVDTLDLVQLHCPPTAVFYRPEIFELFDNLKTEGKVQNLGVSVEKVEEALKSLEYDNVCTVQIIFNMFRQRPSGLFFEQAKKKNIGILARVPLASGLLSGDFNEQTPFSAADHRSFNRNGEQFDKGETFSGIEYSIGLAAVNELKEYFDNSEPLASLALRWILMFEEVSCVIPGASSPAQVQTNVLASSLSPLTPKQMEAVRSIYEKYFSKTVHHWW